MGAITELLRTGDMATAVIVGAVILATLALFFVLVTTMSGEQRRSHRRIASVVQGRQALKGGADSAANLRRSQYDTAIPTIERILKQVLPRPELLRQKLTRTGLPLTIGHYAAGCLVAGLKLEGTDINLVREREQIQHT